MLSTKTRNIIIALVASTSFGFASEAPAVSQALKNNFGYLKSNEYYKLKSQGENMPCQPLFQAEVPSTGNVIVPVGKITTVAGATAVTNAQQTVSTTLGQLQTQTCDGAAETIG